MKNGCKDFISPTMDKLKIDKFSGNRLHDIPYAQVVLELANHRGRAIGESRQLISELREYIIYLYKHIEQLEKDKKYSLERRLKTVKAEKEKRRELQDKINKIQAILSEKNGVADSQEFGLHYGQIHDYLDQIEEVIGQITE